MNPSRKTRSILPKSPHLFRCPAPLTHPHNRIFCPEVGNAVPASFPQRGPSRSVVGDPSLSENRRDVHPTRSLHSEKNTMKRHIFFLLALAGLVTACASTSPVPEGTGLEDSPEWVQNMGDYQLNFGESSQGIGAVGSAPKSSMGTQVQREDALLAARNQLAVQIKVRVRSVITQTRQRLLEAGVDGAEEIGRLNTENAIMQKVDETIVGSRVLKQWKDSESGELYVWVVLDKTSMNRIKQAALGTLKGEKLDEAQKRHKETIDRLFQENMDNLGGKQ